MAQWALLQPFNTMKTVLVLCVSFDNSYVGHRFKSSEYSGAIPIHKIEQPFFYNGRVIIRQQFPLAPSWACTINKMQDATLQQVVVSLRNALFEKGVGYVALSRVSTLQGLFFLFLFLFLFLLSF